jgi:hypothetical protein
MTTPVTLRLVQHHCDLRSQQHLGCEHSPEPGNRWRVTCTLCGVSHLYVKETAAIQARERHLLLSGHRQRILQQGEKEMARA